MPSVKMWAVITGDTIASFQIYTFKEAAQTIRDRYNAKVKADGFKWRYRVVPVTVTWGEKEGKG